jgi:hypothetical protein
MTALALQDVVALTCAVFEVGYALWHCIDLMADGRAAAVAAICFEMVRRF